MQRQPAFTFIELLVVLGIIAVLAALLLPAVYHAKEAPRGTIAKNCLKQLGLAMHNYHDHRGFSLPPAFTVDEAGTPLYSWRVLLLPFVERQRLFEQFQPGEPWDGDENRKLLPEGPWTYAFPPDNGKRRETPWQGVDRQFTHYSMIVGPDTISDGPNAVKLSDIADGTSNTIFFVETRKKIPWSAPIDLLFESLDHGVTKPGGPEESVGSLRKNGMILVCMADGSVRELLPTMSPKVLKSLAVIDNGGPVDWYPDK